MGRPGHRRGAYRIINATSESLNRLAKLEARLACGFRNPVNQAHRIRIACTRGYRRQPRTAERSQSCYC